MADGVLQGKVALVTGAGSPIGIGRTIALALLGAGARVALMDINREYLDQTAAEARALAGNDAVLSLTGDVTDPADAERVIAETIARFGALNVLVNNAGTHPRVLGYGNQLIPFWKVEPEAWSRIITINTNGAFFMSRAAVPHMMAAGWGRLISVTTSFDTMLREGSAPYGPSKAGHEALVVIMSKELAGTGVTANVLVPGGSTNTNMIGPDVDRSKLIQPEVMAGPAVWLASDESAGFTGQRIVGLYWDESLPIAERLERSTVSAGWPVRGPAPVRPTPPPVAGMVQR